MTRFFSWVFVVVSMVQFADAGVVLSNMGEDGLTNTSSSTSDGASASYYLASGFTTGSDSLQLDWVSLVVADDTNPRVPGPRTVGLYSDNAGLPGALIKLSAPTFVSDKAVYTFSFDDQILAANTGYWVVQGQGTTWYRMPFFLQPGFQPRYPIAINNSGFTYDGEFETSDGGGSWVTFTRPHTISVSAVPVPEPSAWVMGLAGIACGGWQMYRRRRARS